MRKPKLLFLVAILFCCQLAWSQARTITGKVTDGKDGSALAGVSVLVKGATTGTITGSDGAYSITLSSNASSLIFSSLGFETQEVVVKGYKADVSMSAGESKSLNEVVVVGYGTNSRREVTGNIARVKGADVQGMPVPNFSQALQGRAAGVFVESQNGKVGDGIKVRVRGGSSISGSNSPLYVVDGVPMVDGTLYGSGTADINFDDVESFDILKDASAAAIYGSRASNGVVLITTKRGKAGKTRFTVNTQYGWNSPTNDNRGFLNAAEYIDYFTKAAVNAGKYHYNRAGNWRNYASEQAAINDMTTYVEGRFTRYSGGTDWRNLAVDNNWEEQAFQKANTGQVEISAQGGSEKTKFYISGFFNTQDGILIGNKFERSGVRANIDNDVNKWLKLGLNLAITKINRDRVPDDNQFTTPMQIVALAPITPTRNSSGLLNNTPTTTYYNPLLDFEYGRWELESWRNQGKIFADVSLLKGLVFHSEFGVDLTNQNEDRYWGPLTLTGNVSPDIKGVARNQWYRSNRWIVNNYFNYQNIFAEKHKFDATLGMSYESTKNTYTSVTGQGFADEALQTVSSASEITDGDGNYNEDNLVSYFGRLNYSFDQKIIVGLNTRIDGSARFGKDKKYGFFPAASVGWIMTESDFMAGSRWISFLKPKISYGITGNNAISLYQSVGSYDPSSYAKLPGFSMGNAGNPQLKWETTRQFDAGIEFGLFNNRLTGEFDYYVKKTKDLIYNRPVTSISGVTSLLSNIGEMENKGVELVLNSTNISTKNFRWTTSLNISKNKNKVLKLDGEQTVIRGDARFANSIVVGQPIGIFYGVKYAGVDPSNGDPIYYLPDGKTTTNDYGLAGTDFILGDPNPDWIGGLSNTFSWKGIELSFLLQAVIGNQVQDGAGGFMSASADWFDNQTKDQLNAWTKPGDVTMVPEARLNRFGDFASPQISSRYVYDASYMRLKTITLGYTLPKTILSKLQLSNARVFVSGVNLLTLTTYPGWDPEVNTDYRSGNVNQGSDFYAAPQIKSVVVGLSIGF